MAHLLLLRAEGEQHRPDHLRTEGHRPRRAGEVAFLLEDELLRRRPARSAGGLRPVGAHPAPVGDRAHPVHDILAREQAAVSYLVAHILREPLADEGAYLFAEGAVLLCYFHVHDVPPSPAGEATAFTLSRQAAGPLQNIRPPSGTGRSGASSTTSPSLSGKPSTSTSDMNLPICFAGKLTTPATWRPTSVSGL